MATATGQLFADYETSELRRFQQALNECSQYMPKNLAMKLPGIIVVGDQSSGKSTVLQTLSREPTRVLRVEIARDRYQVIDSFLQ